MRLSHKELRPYAILPFHRPDLPPAQGPIIAQRSDLLHDPFVLEFLKIPEPPAIEETDWETRLCNHL